MNYIISPFTTKIHVKPQFKVDYVGFVERRNISNKMSVSTAVIFLSVSETSQYTTRLLGTFDANNAYDLAVVLKLSKVAIPPLIKRVEGSS
jgi:hypothetical protein